MPKILKHICILLMLFCLPFFNSCAESAEKEPLEAAFGALDIRLEEMRLVAWRALAEDFLNTSELISVLRAAAATLDAKVISEAQEEHEEYHSCTILARGENAQYTLIAQSLPGESYLIISATGRESIDNLAALRESLYEAVGKGSSLNALLIGSYKGNMQGEWEQQIDHALEACAAQMLEETASESFYSCTAYCPQLGNAVLSGDDMVNLQIAASYDEAADLSYYYLGYPLIYNDY